MLWPKILVFTCLVLLQSGSAVSLGGRGYDYGRNLEPALLRREDDQNSLVQPIPYNDTIPLRLEIRDLKNHNETWTLYILAMSWMQWMNQSDPLSWYSVTGIHGAPFADYGGVKAVPGNKANGYCTHVSNLFPTWHRPYLALYEQTIYKFVQMIANWFPPDRREAYQKAAATFRIPYWDWALKPAPGESVWPMFLGGMVNIEIDGPNGVQNISNPLYSYTFKPLNSSDFDQFPFMYWNETKRRPQPQQSANATSDNGWVAQALDSHLSSIQQRLYTLFSNYKDYATWSNEAWITDVNNASTDSIESLHDTIHLACGGNYGHMAIIAYSSFDPVFFLHHANLDRLFAMWQVVHNDSYVESMKAILPTRTIYIGDVQDARSDLTPFYRNETSFWNSDQVRDHKVFGYSYADAASGNRSEVIATINKLYTDFSPATMNLSATRRPLSREMSWKASSSGSLPVELIMNDGQYQEWIANIRVNKHTLNASFNIYLFLGEIPESPSEWDFASNMAGTLGVFAGPQHHAGAGQQKVSGTVPLTSALVGIVASGGLASLDPRHTGPFLRQNLGFRIKHNNGSMVAPTDADGLSISIVSSSVKSAANEHELARWGDVTSHFDLY
ncbi:hypothetical protein JX266_009446 [Neoarthrinium moseri]|nr:hypothetical protein JX266_009446 [Neoarthrinium moseri]